MRRWQYSNCEKRRFKKALFVLSASIIVCISGCGTNEIAEDVNNTNSEKQLNAVRALVKDHKYGEALSLLDTIGMLDKESSSAYWDAQREKSKIKLEKMFQSDDAGDILDLISEIEKMYVNNDTEYAIWLDSFSGELAQYIDEEADYFDFYRWELLYDNLKDSYDTCDRQLADAIGTVLERKEERKLLLALEGQWMRTDDTFFSGSIMDISYQNNVRRGILTSTVDNVYGFRNGDVKWRNIKIAGTDKITFEDLSRSAYTDSWGGVTYTQQYNNAYGVIDFDSFTIDVVVAADPNSAGTYQRWTRVVKNTEEKLSE